MHIFFFMLRFLEKQLLWLLRLQLANINPSWSFFVLNCFQMNGGTSFASLNGTDDWKFVDSSAKSKTDKSHVNKINILSVPWM